MTFKTDIFTAFFALSAAAQTASAGHTLVAFVIDKAFSAIRTSTVDIILKVACQAQMFSALTALAAAAIIIAHTAVITQNSSVLYTGTAAVLAMIAFVLCAVLTVAAKLAEVNFFTTAAAASGAVPAMVNSTVQA